jgi:hypothetical protein
MHARSQVRARVFPGYPEPHFTGPIGTGGIVAAAGVSPTGATMRMPEAQIPITSAGSKAASSRRPT